ncbi:MAG: MBOAT family protein [Acidimicrobiia bacterium]|nr:MBOAT family protein [Acidimicrobiia bacterium]
MLFPTVAFALFFCVAFLANWLLRPKPTVWRVAMIGLSFFFYGYWDVRFVTLLAGSIVLNHIVATALFAKRVDGRLSAAGRRVLVAGVAANLGILGFFKYYGFFVTSAENALGRFGIEVGPPLLDITLPIGISFFTFQAISYIVDIGRSRFDRPLPLLSLGFYLSFFPQLVAGPIVRATDMAPQISRRPDPRTIPAGEAFWLIAQGLVKKVVISSYLATNLVDPVFDVPGDHSRFEVLLAIYGYAIQIYADFSGYTDIAIGCALLLGFRFPQNFDSPYRARSIAEFWHRWHISLSTWLRDYLYIPLGGNRRGRLLTQRNLAITMVLGGLWHGAAWTFVAWGAIHAIALGVERVLRERWRPLGLPPRAVATLSWLTTFHVICAAWVFFRADSLTRAFELLERLVAGGEPSTVFSAVAVTLIAAVVASQFLSARSVDRIRSEFARAAPLAQITLLALTLTIIDAFGPDGVAPFIYFQF